MKLYQQVSIDHSDCSSEADSLQERTTEDPEIFNNNSFTEKYDIMEKIGEGGSGCVYRCRHKINNHIYAVKKFGIKEENLMELKRSFIIMKELSHPSICNFKALYLGNQQKVAYLVMEYLPYPSLAETKLTGEK